jgi:hypothetical protein
MFNCNFHNLVFKKNHIVASGGTILWCNVCRCACSPRASHCVEHINTPKHVKFAVLRAKEVAEGVKSRNFILEYFTRSRAKSETIDIRTLEFRFKTMTNFLKNGTPLLKIDGFRDYLQDTSGMSLTASTYMRQLLPSLLEQEIHTIKEEIDPYIITIIFDGSARVSEVFSIIFRYCTNDFKITERLVELGNYAHGFNHHELVSAVKVIISKYDLYLGSAERGKIMDNGQVNSFQRGR